MCGDMGSRMAGLSRPNHCMQPTTTPPGLRPNGWATSGVVAADAKRWVARMRALTALFATVVLASCAARVPQYAGLAKLETPRAWAGQSEWRVHVVGQKREEIGEITLVFTGDEVQTCVAGNWKRAEMKSTSVKDPPLHHWYTKKSEGGAALYPAYLIEGQNLWVLLNAPICDNDWELRGVLSSDGATGEFSAGGLLGSKTLGSFTAERP